MKIKETAPAYATNKTNYTYKDYLLLPDDGNRYEVIEGELLMSPAPKINHQRVSRELGFKLIAHVNKNRLGEVFAAPCDVLLSDENTVQPDILFIAAENSGIVAENNIQGAPDLLIEIVSQSTENVDRGIKKSLYEKFGVKEYWVVDPDKKSIDIFTLNGGKYQIFARAESSGKIVSHILKNFELEIVTIFDKAL